MHHAGYMKLRPEVMWIDSNACIECGLCEELAPGMLKIPDCVPVNAQTLEAMSVCPTGAIRWLEGEEQTCSR